jgi:hypothetical protein
MTDQERIKLLREKANWHDRVSRELHASADQLEEKLKQRKSEYGEAA